MASITDQNWVVWNQGKNPLVNFNFMLRVELAYDLPCKSVRAFSRELEYDYIQEGGLNDYVHMRRKPITRPFTLEVERYVGVDYVDPLPLGADLVLPVMLFVSRNHDQFIPGVVARTYIFTGCTVMKKTYGDLVADQSGLLVETTTLGYREMLCVDIPWSEVGDDISKDVQSSGWSTPTAAKTQDKTPEEYKAMAQRLCDQAQEAQERCGTEYQAVDADALIQELARTISRLEAAVGPNGSLETAVQTAQKGLTGEGGKTKQAIADELYAQIAEAQETANEQEAALRAAHRAVEETRLATEDMKAQTQALQEELDAFPSYAEINQMLRNPKIFFRDPHQHPMMLRTERKKLESRLKDQKEKLAAAEQAEIDAQTAVKTTEQAAQKAQQAMQEASKAASAARDEASAAQQALTRAETALKQGKEQLNLLQNSKTNLSLRQERTAQAQTDCGTQFQACQQMNSVVQALSLEETKAIYDGYLSVSELSKKTCYHERQVRETAQHMQTARKLITDAESLLGSETETETEPAT